MARGCVNGNLGPEAWVPSGNQPNETLGLLWQRGMSGSYMGSNGYAEFLALVSDLPNELQRDVSVLSDFAGGSDKELERITRDYVNPIAVRGRTQESDVNPHVAGSPEARTIPPGNLTRDRVQDFGIFLPNGGGDVFNWTRSYIELVDALVAAGMTIFANTRGGRFYHEVKSVWDTLELDAEGRVYVNANDVKRRLRDLFDSWR